MTNWQVESPPQIPVQPKLIYRSKSTMGALGAIVSLSLGLLSQQTWVAPDIAKFLSHGNTAALVCGVISFIGGVDRKDLFFRPSELRKAAEQAAGNFTILEAAKTIEQASKVITAPKEEQPNLAVDLLVDFQARLTAQDAVLAEIKAATTANQFPAFGELPPEPDAVSQQVDRGQGFRVPPPLMGEQMPVNEPDVLQANSEGVWENY